MLVSIKHVNQPQSLKIMMHFAKRISLFAHQKNQVAARHANSALILITANLVLLTKMAASAFGMHHSIVVSIALASMHHLHFLQMRSVSNFRLLASPTMGGAVKSTKLALTLHLTPSAQM